MSTFKWEISEPAEHAASGAQSGTIELEDVKTLNSGSVWWVQSPDSSVALLPQPSGEVELSEPKNIRSHISKGVVNFGLSVLILIIGFIVVHDVIIGSLSFEKLLWVLGPFLVGLNVGDRKSNRSRTTSKRQNSTRKS